MRRTLLALAVLLLTALLVPLASAQDDASECDVSDVTETSYLIYRADGSTSLASNMTEAELREGDEIAVQVEADAECVETTMTLISFSFHEDEATVFEVAQDRGYYPYNGSPSYTTLDVALPACTFEVYLVIGDALDDPEILDDEALLIDFAAGGETECAAPALPACPPNVTAEYRKSESDEQITIEWDNVAGVFGYNVYRAEGDGELELIAEMPQGSILYIDHDLETGATYSYMVTAVNSEGESEDCGTIEITAVPFFGSALLTALALLGAVGALVVLRRR